MVMQQLLFFHLGFDSGIIMLPTLQLLHQWCWGSKYAEKNVVNAKQTPHTQLLKPHAFTIDTQKSKDL